MPVDTVLPHLVYRNVADAVNWLAATFGFTEHYRYGDPGQPSGAQLHPGGAWVMLSTPRPGSASPLEAAAGRSL